MLSTNYCSKHGLREAVRIVGFHQHTVLFVQILGISIVSFNATMAEIVISKIKDHICIFGDNSFGRRVGSVPLNSYKYSQRWVSALSAYIGIVSD